MAAERDTQLFPDSAQWSAESHAEDDPDTPPARTPTSTLAEIRAENRPVATEQ